MNIGLIGYGRMGRLIEEVAKERDHKMVSYFTSKDPLKSIDQLEDVECLIDFSSPDAVAGNIALAFEAGQNILVGTTGWDKKILGEYADISKSAIFVSPNFSIGVNLFLSIVENASKLLDAAGGYDVAISETHHKEKLDSPSGTALKIAEKIIESSSSKNNIMTDSQNGKVPDDSVRITSERIGDEVGTHEVFYESEVETMTLRHQMKDRKVFALGALTAAEWLRGRTGILGFEDYLREEFNFNRD